ncbi:MAG: F0F1 ATP synthase subunit B [Hyphomicrobiales bacterium]
MELIKPGLGLIFWMTLSFGILLFILRKFAWKPILSSLSNREDSIEKALQEAAMARREVEQLKANNEALLQEARLEKDLILKEARQLSDQIIQEAQGKASIEAEKILKNAHETIVMERKAAVSELKAEVAGLSINIAEKLLQDQMQSDQAQKDLIGKMIDQAKLN